MAEGRSGALWQHTSHVLALVANVNRDAKRRPRPFLPADFDPHARPARHAAAPGPTVRLRDVASLRAGLPTRRLDPDWFRSN
jgi:hypothetical protein